MPQSNRLLFLRRCRKILSGNSERIEVVTWELLVHHSRSYIPVLSAKFDSTPSSMSTGTEPPSPAPYQPFLQRRESQESRQPLSSRSASSSLFPSRTLETWVRAHSPYSPSQDRNRLTSPVAFTYPILFVVSVCAEGTRVGRRTWRDYVKLNASAADELFVHLDSLRFCRYPPPPRSRVSH
jgi:hypothetical protein